METHCIKNKHQTRKAKSRRLDKWRETSDVTQDNIYYGHNKTCTNVTHDKHIFSSKFSISKINMNAL